MDRDPAAHPAPSLAPEHDWSAASCLIHPVFRPVGTSGNEGHERHLLTNSPGLPLTRPGPVGLPIFYVIPAQGFDVLVGMEHLMAWGVGPDEVHNAAMSNLAAWSKGAAWVDEIDGKRRVEWSDWGEGMDAVRILLPEVRERLASDFASAQRILVGVPERDLMIAAGLTEGDDEFADMFADYVADRARSADDPIDDRLFELVEGELSQLRVLAKA
jgi:hypothetical protein